MDLKSVPFVSLVILLVISVPWTHQYHHRGYRQAPVSSAVTLVESNNVSQQIIEDALLAVETAFADSVRTKASLEEILDLVSAVFEDKYGGSWYCFRADPQIIKSKLKNAMDGFVLMRYEMNILLFKMKEVLSGGINPGRLTTVKPPVTREASEREMIELTRRMMSSDEDLIIYRNTLPKDVSAFVMSSAKSAIQRGNTFDEISENLSQAMNERFNGSWNSFVMCRMSGDTSVDNGSEDGNGLIDPRDRNSVDPGLSIYFGLGKLKVAALKTIILSGTVKPPSPKVDATISEVEAIADARNNLQSVIIRQSDLRPDMQRYVVGLLVGVLSTENDFKSISKQCRMILDKSYGPPWDCSVGVDGFFWTNFYYKKPFIMNMKVGKLIMLAFKQLH